MRKLTQYLWCSWIQMTFSEAPMSSQDRDTQLEEASWVIMPNLTAVRGHTLSFQLWLSFYPAATPLLHSLAALTNCWYRFTHFSKTTPCIKKAQTPPPLSASFRYKREENLILLLQVPKYECQHTRKGFARYMESFINAHFSYWTIMQVLSCSFTLFIHSCPLYKSLSTGDTHSYSKGKATWQILQTASVAVFHLFFSP